MGVCGSMARSRKRFEDVLNGSDIAMEFHAVCYKDFPISKFLKKAKDIYYFTSLKTGRVAGAKITFQDKNGDLIIIDTWANDFYISGDWGEGRYYFSPQVGEDLSAGVKRLVAAKQRKEKKRMP